MAANGSFLEEKSCLLCSTDSYEIVYHYPPDRYDHSVYETCSWDGREIIPLTIVKCSNCGLVYTRPSFKASALDKVYPKDVVHDVHFDTALRDPKHNTIIHIAGTYFPEREVLIDIGTRYGALPCVARQFGYRAYGLEYNLASVQLARSRGLDYIFQGTADDLVDVIEGRKLSSAEIVVMDDVLEHLVNPLKDLKQISMVQEAGDGLIMRQMNWNSLGRYLFGANWYYIQPAAHMFYFDPKRAKALLNKAGYEVIRVVTPNFLKNVFRTTLIIVRGGLSRLKISNVASSKKNPLYLSKRKKSWNDMFTVIARKC